MAEIAQGAVWLAHLDEGYDRPCIVVSRGGLNRGRLILVVPCFSSSVAERAVHPNYVFLIAGLGGLPSDSVVATHLIQPIDRSRFLHRYGMLSQEDLGRVLLALAWTVDLFDHVE
jgi:mRNA-degrading endonuclease toxin of MazEF toxin-antitoxin module